MLHRVLPRRCHTIDCWPGPALSRSPRRLPSAAVPAARRSSRSPSPARPPYRPRGPPGASKSTTSRFPTEAQRSALVATAWVVLDAAKAARIIAFCRDLLMRIALWASLPKVAHSGLVTPVTPARPLSGAHHKRRGRQFGLIDRKTLRASRKLAEKIDVETARRYGVEESASGQRDRH